MPVDPQILPSLFRLLRAGQVLTNPVQLITYEIDAANDRAMPDAVVFPHSQADVESVLRWAAEHKIPIVARGAGTGLSGGAVAEHGGVILEFSHLDRILEFDTAGRSVVVEPGVINLHLDEAVKELGLYFPPDPASGRSATIGGNIAENAGGPHCFKYGVTTNYITGMKVVLADGQAIQLGGRATDYPGYDLASLVAGSEGTLAIVTQVSFRLLRNPPAVKTMMAAFDSVEVAGEAVSAIISHGLVPATMEFMDQKMMRIIEDYAHAGLPVEAGAALIVEVDGYPESLSTQIEEIVALLTERRAWGIHIAQTTEERDTIWYGRKSAAGAMARLSPAYYLLDGTVPRSKLAQALGAINRACDELELRVAYVFHAGDGNLHPFILIEDPGDEALMKRVHAAGRRVMEICIDHGGSITGEHGVGIEKRAFMPLMYNSAELQAMLEIKEVFDPQGILNPGKIFPPAEPANLPARIPTGVQPALLDAPFFSPQTLEEARDAICAWTEASQSIRLRGAGTKSSLLPEADVTLCTTRMSGIHQVAPQDLYVTAGAGTSLAQLQAELEHYGMWAPLVSPWPEATLGGIVAARFNAPLRMKYGSIRDLVLAATLILPDGRIIRAGRPVVKNVAGYDMTKLFVGSHGTLGLIGDVTLKLAPLPRARSSIVIPVFDLHDGLLMGRDLLQVCLNASALALCKNCPGLQEDAPYALVYTVEGLPQDIIAELTQVRQVLLTRGASLAKPPMFRQVEALSGSHLWAEWIASSVPRLANGEISSYLLRLGTPPHSLAEVLAALSASLPAQASFFADLASGIVHIQSPHLDHLPNWRVAAQQSGGYAILLAAPSPWLASQPAQAQVGFMPNFRGHPEAMPESTSLMQRIKACWDPGGLFNPSAMW